MKSLSHWINYLVKTQNIETNEHVQYFKEIAFQIIEPSFDIEQLEAYKHSLVGFYRWDILSILDETNFRVRYHYFHDEKYKNLHKSK